tara:strand:- start:170 stop:535 length:366 start_codon:yes stop_codon:yes gene_type:complete
MKIYSKIIWDKDFNILEEESSEYNGPVVECMGGFFSPPPPPPPPPYSPPPPPPTAPTYPGAAAKRRRGRTLTAAGRGRGVLIKSRSPLGITDPEQLGARKSLLQPTAQMTNQVLRLVGGGY